jgi:predicted dehydrogenase
VTAGPVRVAVLGAGYGSSHLTNLQANPHAEVVVLWSRSADTARRVAAEFGVPESTADWREALAFEPLDAVVVAAPPHLHLDMARVAVSRGCHLLCEKPLASTLEQSRAIVSAAEAAGVIGAVNFDWRSIPDARRLNHLVTTGGLGTVRQGHLRFLTGTQPPSVTYNWRHDRGRAGFGVLGDFHHICDEIHWHFGPVARVSARLRTLVVERLDGDGTIQRCDAEDEATFLMVTRSGVSITGSLSRCAPGTAVRSTECIGSLGTATLTSPNIRSRDETVLEVSPDEVELTFPDVVNRTAQDRFIDAIRDRSQSPETSLRDGLAAFQLAEALRNSSETGGWVELAGDYR